MQIRCTGISWFGSTLLSIPTISFRIFYQTVGEKGKFDVRMREVVDTFPPRLKNIYILSRERHLSVKEIAEKLAVSEQTVKNQLTELLKRLRKKMNNKNFIFWFSIFS